MHPPSRLGTPSGARSQSPAPSSSGYRRPGTAASNNSNANAMAMATTSATAAPLSTPTTVWEYTHPHAHGIHPQSQALALQTQGLTSRIPSSGSSGQPGKMEHGPTSSSPVTPVAGYAAPQSIRRGTGGTLPAREEGMSLANQSPASLRRPGPGPGPPPPMRKDSPGPASAPGSAPVPNWLGAPGPVFRERGEDDTEEVTELENDAHHNEEEDAQRAERRSKRESAPPVASFSAAIAMLRRESPTRSQSGPITTVKQLDEEKQKRGDTYGPPPADDQQPPRDRGRPRTKSQQRLSVVQEQKQLPSPISKSYLGNTRSLVKVQNKVIVTMLLLMLLYFSACVYCNNPQKS